MSLVAIASADPLLLKEAGDLLGRQDFPANGDQPEIAAADHPLSAHDVVLTPLEPDLAQQLNDIAKIREVHSGGLILLAQGLARRERLQLLAAGIDQILSSPLDPDEFILVLRNLHDLMSARAPRRRAQDPDTAWVLDQTEWCLRTPSGHEVPLQRAEVAVLARLFAWPGANQSREVLAASFKSDREDKNRSLDVVVSKIRKKVRDAADIGIPLRSVRGVGYVFVGSARLVSEETSDQRVRDAQPA